MIDPVILQAELLKKKLGAYKYERLFKRGNYVVFKFYTRRGTILKAIRVQSGQKPIRRRRKLVRRRRKTIRKRLTRIRRMRRYRQLQRYSRVHRASQRPRKVPPSPQLLARLANIVSHTSHKQRVPPSPQLLARYREYMMARYRTPRVFSTVQSSVSTTPLRAALLLGVVVAGYFVYKKLKK